MLTKTADSQGNESKVPDSRAIAPQRVQLTPITSPNREPSPPIDEISAAGSVK
ncbi:MAG: hypothetical protein KME32_31350 [Mojavia pulchra JT2-VF2]|uniref:Uncharacterized protein n=1 Tax=Mojavia pulchra JT2-VF2 TaxID=287848 RepID=A0A951UJ93_9NOST|nr:hypothetical protein [Mojavia pulchra JT2-VF2]